METDTEYDNDIAFAYNSIAGAELTIAKMVDQLEDVIVNVYGRTWFDDYKSNWIKRIHRYFNTNNIAHGKSKATWDIITSKVIEKLCCNNYDFKGKKRATESALFESTTASSSTFSIRQVPVSPPKISENCSSAVLLSSAPPSKLDSGSGSTDVIKLLPLTREDA
ncbi:hypothetical protein G6F42_011648 [Rhizopus arrhizus]|nr:hypothetical protein G6F42_011648 [Rhizopus arrhizus]